MSTVRTVVKVKAVKRALTTLLLFGSSTAFVPVTLAQNPSPTRLFAHEAEVRSEHLGLVRLPLDTETLAACREDLSDLRVYRHGVEVPYYVDTDARPWQGASMSRGAEPLGIERSIETPERGPAKHIENMLVALPEAAPPGEHWELSILTSHEDFVRRLTIMTADGDGNAGRTLVRTSIFRMPWPRAQRTRVPLPATDATHLIVRIEGDDFYLEPTFTFASVRGAENAPTLTFPLEEIERREEGYRTRIRLRRPRGFVPNRIRLRTSETTFHIVASVTDVGTDTLRDLGDGVYMRIADLPDATNERIAVSPARSEVLEIELPHGSAPLPQDLRFEAEMIQPALVFDHRPGTRLRFGGGRVRAPRYGVADVLARELDSTRLADATLGEHLENADFDDSPALAFAMHPGADLDLRGYAMQQRLSVPASREGLVRFIPDPTTLAAAAPGLHDLRIVDDGGRQWAHLLGEPDPLPLEVTSGSRQVVEEELWGIPLPASRYPIELPAEPLPIRSIALRSDASYIDRDVALVGIVDDGRESAEPTLLATGRWRLRPDGSVETKLPLHDLRAREVWLWVADGDDAPLASVEATLRVPTPAVYLAAPAGDYTVFVGHPHAEAPSYELARARDLVTSVTPVDAELGALEANVLYEPPSAFAKSWKDILLWIVLILGVLVLLVLTLRSAGHEDAPKKEPSEPEPEPTEPTEEDDEEVDDAA